MPRLIPLTRGQFAIVDDEDFDSLSRFKWYARLHSGNYMAGRKGQTKGSIVLMHRQIMNPPEGMVVDHKNHNTLDNRKINLRVVTHTQNMWNMRRKITNRSGYKGVHWDKVNQVWRSQIKFGGKRASLGRFARIEDAASAYERAANEFHGEFACLG